jgi:hypothetical protein
MAERDQAAPNQPGPSASAAEETQLAASKPPYGYRAFGLTMRSDLALPELDPDAADPPDVQINLGSTGRPPPSLDADVVFESGPEAQYVAWPGVGAFLTRGTHTIIVEPAPGVSMPLLNLPLLGPVMARLLYLRGMLVLHASAIDLAGRGAVFLGPKGAGKSTTVAAFVGAGHRLLTDDVLAVRISDVDNPRIVPGFPQLKLSKDAASRLVSHGAVAMPPPIPEFPKQQRRLTGPFSHTHVVPACLYVLARGDVARIMPLPAQEALGALLSFSFASLFHRRYGQLGKAEASRHLAQCAALAGSVRIARLELPSGLDHLTEVVRLVADDIG